MLLEDEMTNLPVAVSFSHASEYQFDMCLIFLLWHSNDWER